MVCFTYYNQFEYCIWKFDLDATCQMYLLYFMFYNKSELLLVVVCFFFARRQIHWMMNHGQNDPVSWKLHLYGNN